MQIAINLATRQFVDVRPLTKRLKTCVKVLGVINLCVGVLVYVAHSSSTSSQARAHDLDRIATAQSAELVKYRSMMERPENVLLADRTNALNQLLDEKAFSWTLLMQSLEGDVPADVQLASIQPVRAKDGSITLKFHVVGPRARAIELIANMEQEPCFPMPRILGENVQDDARAKEPPHALSDSTVEEFEVETGYDESQAAIAPRKDAPDQEEHGADPRRVANTAAVSTSGELRGRK